MSFWKVIMLTITPKTKPNQTNKTWYIGKTINSLRGQYINGWKSLFSILNNSNAGPENNVETDPVTPKTINIITT